MRKEQLARNTVAFRGLPPAILESDDRLMKFAELALQEFEPVHFEINENTLIATFKVPITPNDLQVLFLFCLFVYFLSVMCNFEVFLFSFFCCFGYV